MCIAMPGKVIIIDGDTAKVDFGGNLVDVNVALIDVKVDDYVLVHAGCAIEVMNKEKAEELQFLFGEVEALGKEPLKH